MGPKSQPRIAGGLLAPVCGCKEHEGVSELFNINTTRSFSKKTITLLKENNLLKDRCNFLCKPCYEKYVFSDNPSVDGGNVKRKATKSLIFLK